MPSILRNWTGSKSRLGSHITKRPVPRIHESEPRQRSRSGMSSPHRATRLRAKARVCFTVLFILILTSPVASTFALVHTAGEVHAGSQTIFKNGVILTMDEEHPSAEAVLIQDNIILAVGTEAEIDALASSSAAVYDLQGHTLMPGFIDAHAHRLNNLGTRWSLGLSYEDTINKALQYGWTSISELFTHPGLIDEVLRQEDEGTNKIRINLYLRLNWMNEKYGDWYLDYSPGQMIGSKVRVAGVKMFTDGSGANDRALSEPYHDDPGNYGLLYFTQEELNSYVERAHDSGFQIAIHTIGDRGIELAINAYEAVLGDESNDEYHHRIEHLFVLRDDLLDRVAAKGLVASVQLTFFSSDWTDWQEEEMGPDRVRWLGRTRDLIDSGTPVVGNSDWPWDMFYWDTSPMEAVYASVTRIGSGTGEIPADWQLAQRITVEEALQLMTINAAYALKQEDELGSITAGKKADLTVLSADPLEVTVDELKDIDALMTMVDGQIVFTLDELTTSTLTVSSTGPGSCNLESGSHDYAKYTTVPVYATPDSGENNGVFSHWVLDGSQIDDTQTLHVNMDVDHTLVAVFSEETIHTEANNLYLVKQVFEVTSDWADIIWADDSFQVLASTYTITEGADAITNIEVDGLDVWFSKEQLDPTKVVIEQTAIISPGSASSSVEIMKGHMESATVRLYKYDSLGEIDLVFEETAGGGPGQTFTKDMSTVYASSSGVGIPTESLPDLEKKVFSFYYPWYGRSSGPSGEEFHYEGVTDDDIHNFDNYPLMGPYDSHDPDVVRAHIRMAKQAGIDGFIVSWWGIDTFEDRALSSILDVAAEEDFSISVYYETVRDLSLENMRQELIYFTTTYCDHTAFLRDSGEPVLFVYVPDYDGRDSEWWWSVREAVEADYGPINLIGDCNDRGMLNAFEAFHTYIYLGETPLDDFTEWGSRFTQGTDESRSEDLIEELRTNGQIPVYDKPFFVTVCPGFSNLDWNPTGLYRDREDQERYIRNWDAAIDLEAPTVLLTSWNEWHEGTELEPSREYGFDYLTLTRQYVEMYKQTSYSSPQPSYQISVDPMIDEPNKASISLTAYSSPAVFIDVTVTGDESTDILGLSGNYYSYIQGETSSSDWQVIPYLDVGETLEILIAYSSTLLGPVLDVEASLYDLAGGYHTLRDGTSAMPLPSTLTCGVSSQTITLGESVTISGSISPVISGVEVDLTGVRPDGTETIMSTATDADGRYTESFTPNLEGTWTIEASWGGDDAHLGAASETINLTVKEDPGPSNIVPGYHPFTVIIGIAIGLLVIGFMRKKG